MTRTHSPSPRFPVAFRVVAVSTALVALVAVAATSGFADPKDELQEARQQRREVEAQLSAAQGELSTIEARLADALLRLEDATGRLEEVTANLQATREERDEAEARFARIELRLNERAAEVFMEGPASDVGFYLGATSLSDLSDRIEFVDVVQQDDADLAQEVLNVRNELIAAEDRLEELQSEARREQAKAQALQDEVQAELEAQQAVLANVESSLAGAKADEKAAEEGLPGVAGSSSPRPDTAAMVGGAARSVAGRVRCVSRGPAARVRRRVRRAPLRRWLPPAQGRRHRRAAWARRSERRSTAWRATPRTSTAAPPST